MNDKQPSAAAMRAARALHPTDADAADSDSETEWGLMCKRDAVRFLSENARLIDRETGLLELIEALEPFAIIGDKIRPNLPDHYEIGPSPNTAGQFYRARSALRAAREER